ncbi:hypothetical protein [Thermoactinomyces sp. CICC 10521]|uniref:hypothetical protein n=1 Tax=Thermoactinomyces sp. CICC 10521 TaxID=2767426 RepID=UPI0018DE600B|nr:hypothetical protein [Thermoactinomyces sp. CICC 10521]MBH8608944.1 hypothetical protein [Thermoactinomyces sp. CICC 10521]
MQEGLQHFMDRIWDWLYPNITQGYTLAVLLIILFQGFNRRYRAYIPITIFGLAFIGLFVYFPDTVKEFVGFINNLLSGDSNA